MGIGKLVQRPISEEMQESYLDYAMSVIVARALPDVRDGLKPVHRRILYAMWSIGLRPQAKFRKSATVVGEVLGKYHPHGDVAVYDSMVRMAQDFSLRYPLVKGQGNFGSMDGDSAAAMRYTEAKLAGISEEMLLDIEKDTVKFTPNYDGSHKEPTVMPAKLPNLLLNGTMGIAVGMATSIAPHNLTEIINGTIHLIDHPGANIDDLIEFIKGPDFPTGGIIYDNSAIKQTYATGKGGIVLRAKAEIVEAKGEAFNIIVSEVPYQVNKAALLEKIADLVRDKKIDGIKDLRDESSKEGVRVVIELKKDAYPKKVLNTLFKLTELQTTFHSNMLALIDGIQPRVLTLKMILEEYIKHRQTIIRLRTEYDLAKAKDRAHILQGLKMALAKIDQIIKTIKQSRDKEIAKINLIKKFKLSERQAVAILEMKLQQLASMERLKIEQELKEKMDLIKELESILKSAAKISNIIKKELAELRDKYGDERRTQIVSHGVKDFTAEDLIPDEDTIVTLTKDGYIKRLPPETFKTQSRGGKGVVGLTTKEEDVVEQFFSTTTHSDILFFTTKGRVFELKAYDIPKGSRTSKGQAIVNFLQLAPDEKISAALPMSELGDYKFLVMVTSKGNIKKVNLSDFDNIRRSGLIAIRLRKNDELEWVKPSTGKDEIILVTALGQAIRFKEGQVRPMGRAAAGVRGVRLKGADRIVSLDIVDSALINAGQLLTVMANGYGKRSHLSFYKTQGRGGSGIKTAKITPKTGHIVAATIVNAKAVEEDMIIISAKGQVIRLPLKSVNVAGRATQGVRLMRFKEDNDKVASVTFI
ncbi:MAG: DNA gyrase subunit A [Candidatus Buchananbacteria bacterium RIFCSPHIGHO2_02_FULL_45_11b]|uniref:DNA gyrase subunit A n=4 Tax=Candidatus Buchananiibacteriota TaxID=1817903 RepID=A0A1G1YK13_9BACT|nr:MAG: DNA gyrase subunit A [Candidatus Buchananbacteria bacterium RIFCSPHIGHO2_01_FULL_46_12]OGY52614.1 MAG: DNA gyrase subunit A [Candidatus Buchananbacteria bacterium RIFCSPHIGHO2_02_FULL_45_11b]OGY54426.1 MAG: DNA gyrase subunit A [Candidatus Buchananbacteria bacterium RIFCSPLOWO2_01_FULL_45_31]OGY58363.1 MAG: DNA gyrase subunit A [Candidatus Buchananbacteria bacterium RIFCSPLOWO2_02_FULL_46_11b]